MANTGQPNTGGSQFFIVSGPAGREPCRTPTRSSVRSRSGLSVVSTIDKQGSTSGIPPDVTQRIISVTINES